MRNLVAYSEPVQETILLQLQKQGFRLSHMRQFLIELFCHNSLPHSITEINLSLEKAGISANKTTVYRELDFLTSQNIIRELDFGEGKKRYELISDDHHHHLICTKCDAVEKVSLNDELKKQEDKIFRQKKFKVTDHMLEFFGVCADCRKI